MRVFPRFRRVGRTGVRPSTGMTRRRVKMFRLVLGVENGFEGFVLYTLKLCLVCTVMIWALAGRSLDESRRRPDDGGLI
jgi:hypothetical protein